MKIPVVLVTLPGFNVKLVPAVAGAVTVMLPSLTEAQLVAVGVAVPTMAGPAAITILAGVTDPVHPPLPVKVAE